MKKILPGIRAFREHAAAKLLASFLLLALVMPCYYLHAQKKQAPATNITQKAAPAFTYRIIDGANSTFGYDVYVNGVLKLHQPSIPAMPGNEGFKTKAAAEQVAQLAIKKMKKGESLPTISPQELKKLKVI